MTNQEVIIIRTCKELETCEEVSLSYAVEKLQGYFYDSIDNSIESQLLNGDILFTPYALYKLKTTN